MKTSRKKFLTGVLILLASVLLLSTNASAVMAPYLNSQTGSYSYDATSMILSFSGMTSDWVEYTDGSYAWDSFTDPIVGATLSFGMLMNSTTNNLIFGPSPGGSIGPVSFTIDGFITATLNNFVVDETGTVNWVASLSNIQKVDGAPYSQYVEELLANGGGNGNFYINFFPGSGGTENFTATSLNGTFTATVAAPEPVSAILFVAGGATLALRRFRKKSS